MEKQLKKIADELQLIRKELQKSNRAEKVEYVTNIHHDNPIKVTDAELLELLRESGNSIMRT